MVYLTASYDLWVVAASVMVASFASYVTLDLAKRVRSKDRGVALSWWIGGSIAMGTGIWSMHFVGMLAFSLPIALGYTKLLTFLSWIAAVAVSAIALAVASLGSRAQFLVVRRYLSDCSTCRRAATWAVARCRAEAPPAPDP